MKKLFMMLTTSAFIAGSGHAAPAAFTPKHCGSNAKKIVNETNSTIIGDDQNCSKFWVLPPQLGKVKSTNFVESGNLGFCNEMKYLQAGSRRLAEQIEHIQYDVDRETKRLEEITEEIKKVTFEQKGFVNDHDLITYADLKNANSDLMDLLEDISSQLSECKEDCNHLLLEYQKTNDDLRELRKEQRKFRQERREDIRTYEKFENRLRNLKALKISAKDNLASSIERQVEIKKTLNDMYSHYGKLEGGYVTLNYSTMWDKNVASLEKKYPSLIFSKVDTRNAKLIANFVGGSDKDAYLNSLPILLDYSLAGFKYVPYGEEKENNLVSVPTKFQGDLRLSVVGACPVYYKNYLTEDRGKLEINPNRNNEQLTFGLSVTYQHPAIYNFALDVKYNLYKFYQKVVKSGSKGGFFSSKSWTSITETKVDKSTFDIEWHDEGLYSKQEKTQMTNALKLELAARAIQIMGMPIGSRVPNLSATVDYQPQQGALVLAQGLEKTCGWYSYKCAAASWVLRGLSSTFGRSKSESSFQSTHDVTVTEKLRENDVIWKVGATSYSSK